MIRSIVLLALILLASCQSQPEDAVKDRLEELVTALNAKDIPAASKMFKGGEIPAVDNAGDSSVIYRLLHIPGSEDIELDGVTTTVIEDRARASIGLHGKVVRGDSVVGEMTLPLKLELQYDPSGQWMILP